MTNKNDGNGGPPSLSSLPPGFFGIMEPRPYKNITELISTLGNVLIAGEKAQHPFFKERFLKLFDTMHKGLALYIDQEFYSKTDNKPIIIPMQMPEVFVSTQMPSDVNKVIVRPTRYPYTSFGDNIPNSEDESPEIS